MEDGSGHNCVFRKSVKSESLGMGSGGAGESKTNDGDRAEAPVVAMGSYDPVFMGKRIAQLKRPEHGAAVIFMMHKYI